MISHLLFRVVVVLFLANVMPLLGHSHLGAADHIEAAKVRHTWTWFGLNEVQAQAEANRQKMDLVVVRRDDKEQEETIDMQRGAVVMVHIQDGRVLWAEVAGVHRGNPEGVKDSILLPWLGLTEKDVVTQAEAAGRAVRVVARDGEHFIVTQDFNEQRINLHTLKGVVVAITTG